MSSMKRKMQRNGKHFQAVKEKNVERTKVGNGMKPWQMILVTLFLLVLTYIASFWE